MISYHFIFFYHNIYLYSKFIMRIIIIYYFHVTNNQIVIVKEIKNEEV